MTDNNHNMMTRSKAKINDESPKKGHKGDDPFNEDVDEYGNLDLFVQIWRDYNKSRFIHKTQENIKPNFKGN